MEIQKIKFSFSGHKNLLGMHKNTFEFTKENKLTKKGDCIIGVEADFDYKKLKEFCKKFNKAKIFIYSERLMDQVTFFLNKDFDSEEEMVIRKSVFISKRTFGILADKSAYDLNRELIKNIKNKGGYCEIISL